MKPDGRIYGDPGWSATLNRWEWSGVRGEHVGSLCRCYPYARRPVVRPLYVWAVWNL